MPELTIVESWRAMTVRSVGLDALERSSRLISFDSRLSAMSRTISPRALQLVGDRLLGVGLDLAGGLRRR